MDSVKRIVEVGVCVGCGACQACEHIRMERSNLGFDVPVVDETCTGCGKCVQDCVFDPLRDDE